MLVARRLQEGLNYAEGAGHIHRRFVNICMVGKGDGIHYLAATRRLRFCTVGNEIEQSSERGTEHVT